MRRLVLLVSNVIVCSHYARSGALLASALAVVAGVSASATASGRTLPRGAKVVASVPIPAGTGGFAVGAGAVWAVSDTGPVLTRIDPSRNAVTARINFSLDHPCPADPPGCGEAAAGNGAVWVTHSDDGTISRVDPATNTVTATIRVGSRPIGIASSPGAVWVANSGDPSVSRIDPSTNRVVATIRLGPPSAVTDRAAVTTGGGAVWATRTEPDAIVRIDPSTNKVTSTIKLALLRSGQPCGFMAVARGAVWAAGAHCPSGLSGYGVVTRISQRKSVVAGTVTGFKAPIGLAAGFGSLWVADLDSKQIDRVDLRTGRIVARLPVGGLPIRLGIGYGSIWVRDDTGRVLRIRPATGR